MSRIQLRLFDSAFFPAETPVVGEPYWDTLKSRFGVFNNRSNQMEWYPTVDGRGLTLHKDQTLAGTDTAQASNPIALDWTTPNALRILNRGTNEVIAEFTDLGATFTAAGSVSSGVNGIVNRIINAPLHLFKAIDHSDAIVNKVGIGPHEPKLIAPNWLFFKKNGSAGDVSAQIDYVDKPSPDITASIRLIGNNAPTDGGIRHFITDTAWMRGKNVTFSNYIKGPLGVSARRRIKDSDANIDVTEVIVGTGNWERISTTIAVPSNYAAAWIALDSLYAPGFTSVPSTTWRVAAPVANVGAFSAPYDQVNLGLDKFMSASLYGDGDTFIVEANVPTVIPMKFVKKNPSILPRAYAISPLSNPITIVDISESSVVIELDSITGLDRTGVVAYFAPFTVDTQ